MFGLYEKAADPHEAGHLSDRQRQQPQSKTDRPSTHAQ
jgi:hypothetical protein